MQAAALPVLPSSGDQAFERSAPLSPLVGRLAPSVLMLLGSGPLGAGSLAVTAALRSGAGALARGRLGGGGGVRADGPAHARADAGPEEILGALQASGAWGVVHAPSASGPLNADTLASAPPVLLDTDVFHAARCAPAPTLTLT